MINDDSMTQKVTKLTKDVDFKVISHSIYLVYKTITKRHVIHMRQGKKQC